MSEPSGFTEQEEKDLRKKLTAGLGSTVIQRFKALQTAVTDARAAAAAANAAAANAAAANAAAANATAPTVATLPTVGNNTAPTFTAPSDWNKTVDGNVIALLTEPKVKYFFMGELLLSNKQIHILRTEGITHPIDLAQFDSEDCDAVIKSVKGLRVPLGGLSQILLKQACDFMQYLESTDREIKDAYLLWTVIKNHAIQFKAIKDLKTNKDGPTGLPKLGKSTDVLG